MSPATHCYRWSLSAGVSIAHIMGCWFFWCYLTFMCVTVIINHKYTWYHMVGKIAELSFCKGGSFVYCLRAFAFHSLLLPLLSSPMLTQPYASHTAQIPGANHIYCGAPSFQACLDQKPGEDNSGASKLSQMILFDNVTKVLWRSCSRQVYHVKGGRWMGARWPLFKETVSKSCCVSLGFERGWFGGIHLGGRQHTIWAVNTRCFSGACVYRVGRGKNTTIPSPRMLNI